MNININASIVDQQVTGIMENYAHLFFPELKKQKEKIRSAAFVVLCMSTLLDISKEEAFTLLTEGGQDAGVDGLHIGEVEDGEFKVTIFQGKYKDNLRGSANFKERDVIRAIDTVGTLFDPGKKVVLNKHIKPKVEEIRSLVLDCYIPSIQVVLCNNGLKWKDEVQDKIDQTGWSNDKVSWTYFNHDKIVKILQKTKSINETLRLTGRILKEDLTFRQVLIGRISVKEIGNLFEKHGDRLLDRNVRRYLGLHSNRVNKEIHRTLCSEKADNFYFYNNGITVICDKLDYNAPQQLDHAVRLKNMQIINGGQTCRTIQETLKKPYQTRLPGFDDIDSAYVMIRIYQLSEEDAKEDADFVHDITYATNSQNPVNLRDLRSNDPLQKALKINIEKLGYSYKRKREEGGSGSSVITSSIAAEATLAIWRRNPPQAKFRRKEHFGKLYDDIFKGLNAAQALLGVLIFRFVENERKRPTIDDPPDFLPYASHYLAMLIGIMFLQDNKLTVKEISHKNLEDLIKIFDQGKDEYHKMAVRLIKKALVECYGDRPISLQQLAATFRRGDLLEMLRNVAEEEGRENY